MTPTGKKGGRVDGRDSKVEIAFSGMALTILRPNTSWSLSPRKILRKWKRDSAPAKEVRKSFKFVAIIASENGIKHEVIVSIASAILFQTYLLVVLQTKAFFKMKVYSYYVLKVY